jgi:hypothetical protein
MGVFKVFYVTRYYVKGDKFAEYQKWLLSDDAKGLIKRFEKETGWKYLNTYFPILGFGDDALEEWCEVPNWAALDKMRSSKTMEEWSDKTWDFIDMTRSASASVYRTAADVLITPPPKKKK